MRECDTPRWNGKKKLDKLLLRELQYFDLARDMDKVPEFVSHDISKWNVLANHKNNMHWNTPMHDKTWLSTDR